MWLSLFDWCNSCLFIFLLLDECVCVCVCERADLFRSETPRHVNLTVLRRLFAVLPWQPCRAALTDVQLINKLRSSVNLSRWKETASCKIKQHTSKSEAKCAGKHSREGDFCFAEMFPEVSMLTSSTVLVILLQTSRGSSESVWCPVCPPSSMWGSCSSALWANSNLLWVKLKVPAPSLTSETQKLSERMKFFLLPPSLTAAGGKPRSNPSD